MQSTIEYMHSIEPNLLERLVGLGEPEIKEIIRDDYIKYYKFNVKKPIQNKRSEKERRD